MATGQPGDLCHEIQDRVADAGRRFIAGGTCPSDVDNDGTVGITDFLQVLGDWGPCPSPHITAVAVWNGSNGGVGFRVWSDGQIEAWVHPSTTDCWDCPQSDPLETWLDAGTTPGNVPAVDLDVSSNRLLVLASLTGLLG